MFSAMISLDWRSSFVKYRYGDQGSCFTTGTDTMGFFFLKVWQYQWPKLLIDKELTCFFVGAAQDAIMPDPGKPFGKHME
jgi:hypothetical protein